MAFNKRARSKVLAQMPLPELKRPHLHPSNVAVLVRAAEYQAMTGQALVFQVDPASLEVIVFRWLCDKGYMRALAKTAEVEQFEATINGLHRAREEALLKG